MKKTTRLAWVTLALTLTLTSISAFADQFGFGFGGAGSGRGDHFRIDPRWGQQAELIEIPYNVRLTGNNGLQTRNLLGLQGPYYSGRRVAYIKLRASTDAGKGTTSIAVNHVQAGPTQTVGTYTADYYFNPGPNAILDDVVESIVIRTSGNFNIESIAAYVLPWGE